MSSWTGIQMPLDPDGDGIPTLIDNCADVYNPDQADHDHDGKGDACSNPDVDGDGVYNDVDNCPTIYNPDQADADGDGIGDECDVDYLRAALQACRSQLESCCPETAISLSSFQVIPSDEKVTVKWKTESEVSNAGFNVWRAEFQKINTSLIPAQGSPTARASYEFMDNDVQNRQMYLYKLEDIDLNGTSTMHGPVSAVPRGMYEIGK